MLQVPVEFDFQMKNEPQSLHRFYQMKFTFGLKQCFNCKFLCVLWSGFKVSSKLYLIYLIPNFLLFEMWLVYCETGCVWDTILAAQGKNSSKVFFTQILEQIKTEDRTKISRFCPVCIGLVIF